VSTIRHSRNYDLATAIAVVALLGATAVYAEDKFALSSPDGVAFADFRGYEDWAVVSSARTDEVLKVIVANPTMIAAYRSGIPGNGKPFPEGASRCGSISIRRIGRRRGARR
jgi:hypothetical protein